MPYPAGGAARDGPCAAATIAHVPRRQLDAVGVTECAGVAARGHAFLLAVIARSTSVPAIRPIRDSDTRQRQKGRSAAGRAAEVDLDVGRGNDTGGVDPFDGDGAFDLDVFAEQQVG